MDSKDWKPTIVSVSMQFRPDIQAHECYVEGKRLMELCSHITYKPGWNIYCEWCHGTGEYGFP
jgi:hypothetical protein